MPICHSPPDAKERFISFYLPYSCADDESCRHAKCTQMNTTAMGAPVRQGTMLGDLQGRLDDLDLLDNARQLVGRDHRRLAGRAVRHPVDVRLGGEFLGENGVRACLGWPGCPPLLRGEAQGAVESLPGLTMSELGGLEEVEESLLLAASFSLSWRTSSANVAIACSCSCRRWCSVCTSWCIRSQFAQVFVFVWHIALFLLTSSQGGYTPLWPHTVQAVGFLLLHGKPAFPLAALLGILLNVPLVMLGDLLYTGEGLRVPLRGRLRPASSRDDAHDKRRRRVVCPQAIRLAGMDAGTMTPTAPSATLSWRRG